MPSRLFSPTLVNTGSWIFFLTTLLGFSQRLYSSHRFCSQALRVDFILSFCSHPTPNPLMKLWAHQPVSGLTSLLSRTLQTQHFSPSPLPPILPCNTFSTPGPTQCISKRIKSCHLFLQDINVLRIKLKKIRVSFVG